jgi:putative copper resistance protein D
MAGPWDVMVVVAKAVAYAATFGAGGGVFFLIYNRASIEAANGGRIRRFIVSLSIAAACASAAKILLTAGSMSGDVRSLWDPELERMILQAGEGAAVTQRLLGLGCMVAALARCGAQPAGRSAGRRPALALVGAVAAATSFAWVGHVHVLAAPLLGVSIVALHALGAAFWLGAFVPLLIVSRDRDVARMTRAVARFSATAQWVVAVLLLAGVILVCLLLQSPADLWRSDYGRLLLVKIAFVSALLSLAAFNRQRLTPRLSTHDDRAARALRTAIRLEIFLACVIMLVTAAMTTLVGPP